MFTASSQGRIFDYTESSIVQNPVLHKIFYYTKPSIIQTLTRTYQGPRKDLMPGRHFERLNATIRLSMSEADRGIFNQASEDEKAHIMKLYIMDPKRVVELNDIIPKVVALARFIFSDAFERREV